MKIEISNGELVDKVSILSVKLKKIKSEEKLVNIRKEYDLLLENMKQLGIAKDSAEYKDLMKINEELWGIEDKIRIKEANKEFDEEFIELARSVYIQNDKRFAVKSRINKMTGSNLTEEKEYVNYK
jgi:hypothetical protein